MRDNKPTPLDTPVITDSLNIQQTDEVVKEAAQEVSEATTRKVEELAQTVKENTQATTEQTTEVVREIAHVTGEQLETTTNKTLEFLGFTVDIQTLITSSVDFGVKLAMALLVFFAGKWIGTRLVNTAKRIMRHSNMDATTANFLGNVLYGLMLVAVALAALNKLGVNTNSFVAILGAAAVAIGVSLKDQLSNLAAGVMIIIFRPFSRGDVVEVGGKLGTVMNITLVNTRIRTAGNHEIVIPNGDIMTTASINYSSLPHRRVEVLVGMGYENDIKIARQIMLSLADKHELALKDPEPIVRVTSLGDNAVELTLYVWTQNNDWFGVQCDLLEQIKYAFDEQGINIPYPQRSLHIESISTDVLHALAKDKSPQATDSSSDSDPANSDKPKQAGDIEQAVNNAIARSTPAIKSDPAAKAPVHIVQRN